MRKITLIFALSSVLFCIFVIYFFEDAIVSTHHSCKNLSNHFTNVHSNYNDWQRNIVYWRIAYKMN